MRTMRNQSAVRSMEDVAALCATLDEDGFAVVPDALDSSRVSRLRRAFESAAKLKSGTQHVELTNDTPEIGAWRELERHPTLMAAAAHVLASSFYVRELHGRNPLPGFGQQGLHSDWMPRAAGEPYFVFTAIWMLDDFTPLNGATRVVPGSHRMIRPIPKPLAQPLARHADQMTVIGRAGSVLVMNGHVWHSGQRNESEGPRRAAQMVLGRGFAHAAS